MKTVLLILFWAISALMPASAELQPSDIVGRFYEILYAKDKPLIEDERAFFGGESCEHLRITLRGEERFRKYASSETPIWDYLRDQKHVFSTKGMDDYQRMRIQVTEPVETTRLHNGKKIPDKRVFATFPGELVDPLERASKGLSVVIFTLGTECYLEIGSTIIVAGTTIDVMGLMHRSDQ